MSHFSPISSEDELSLNCGGRGNFEYFYEMEILHESFLKVHTEGIGGGGG